LWFPKGFSARLEYLAGNYEPELTQLVKERVRQGMTVVDRGANIGYYTLLLCCEEGFRTLRGGRAGACISSTKSAHEQGPEDRWASSQQSNTLLFSHLVGASGTVYAFEPDPSMYQALLKNISENALTNVKAYEYALGRTSGVASFIAEGGVSSRLSTETQLSDQLITVQIDALDNLLQSAESIDFVKLDVEGAEIECLEGMRNIIQRNPDISVVLEVNLNWLRLEANALFSRLEAFGFEEIYAIEPRIHVESGKEMSNILDSLAAQRKYVFNLLCTRR
jgi:FkbM family methyltransferase